MRDDSIAGLSTVAATYSDDTSKNAEERPARTKRCAQCGGPFGLVRHRRALAQFCSVACVNENAENMAKAIKIKARWYLFLTGAVSR